MALQLVMTSLQNGTYYISVHLSSPGFLQVDAAGNAPVVRRFTGSALQQWQLVMGNYSLYGSIQNVQFQSYVYMFDPAGPNGALTSSTTEMTWYFTEVGLFYTISNCSCLRTVWKVDTIDLVPILALFNSAYQEELWNITTIESLAPTQSPPLSATSIATINGTPYPSPNVVQTTSTAVVHTNTVPLSVGLGVGLGVPVIAAIVFLVMYFAKSRNKPRGKPINPAFDPSFNLRI